MSEFLPDEAANNAFIHIKLRMISGCIAAWFARQNLACTVRCLDLHFLLAFFPRIMRLSSLVLASMPEKVFRSVEEDKHPEGVVSFQVSLVQFVVPLCWPCDFVCMFICLSR